MNITAFCFLCGGYIGSADVIHDSMGFMNMITLCNTCWKKLGRKQVEPKVAR